MSWRDPEFRYVNAEETRKPGYLARKFARIRREQKRIADEQAVKVQPLRKSIKGIEK